MAGPIPGYLVPAGGGGVGTAQFSGGLVSGQDVAEGLVDGSFYTAEPISGLSIAAAVAFTGSGTIRTAMAAVSGRMPAMGICASNYLSGVLAVVQRAGRFFAQGIDFSGWTGLPVFVGRSGQICASNAPQLSGDIQQTIGIACASSGLMIQLSDALEGVIAGSGDIGSGAITGQAGGGFFCVASGSLSTNDLGSGVILSGLLGSGVIGRFHVASGQLAGFELGSGSIVSGRIASGQVGQNHLSSGSVTSGAISSGVVGKYHTASGLLQYSMQFLIDGGGTALASSYRGDLQVPITGKITSVLLLGDQVNGTAFVGIWKDTLANYPPTSGDTISSSGVPLLSGPRVTLYSGTAALSTWATTNVTAGDILSFTIHSGLVTTRATVAIQIGVGD